MTSRVALTFTSALLILLSVLFATLSTTGATSCQQTEPVCQCESRVNILTIVDRSRSAVADVFGNTKAFLKQFYSCLPLGSENIMSACLSFSRRTKFEWDFDNAVSTDLSQICPAIDAIAKPSGETLTHRALKRSKNLFAKFDRPCSTNVALMIVDGNSDNKNETVHAAAALRSVAKLCIIEIRGESETSSQVVNRNEEFRQLRGPDGIMLNANGLRENSDVERAVMSAVACVCGFGLTQESCVEVEA